MTGGRPHLCSAVHDWRVELVGCTRSAEGTRLALPSRGGGQGPPWRSCRMKRRAVAFTLLWLSLLAPGVVRAEGRAFDFSGASRSARLLDRRSPWVHGQTGGDRIHALSHSGVT